MAGQIKSGSGYWGKGLLIVAVLTLLTSIFGVVITYNALENIHKQMTGFAVSYTNSTVNVSVSSVTSLNFTTNTVVFGVGQIATVNGSTAANLSSSGTILGGTSFTRVTSGFILENIGSTNVSLNIMSNKNATTLFGTGTTVTPVFMFNVTQNEAGSCAVLPNPGNFTFQNYTNVNITAPGTVVCNDFRYADADDSLRVDVFFSIPYDTPNTGTNINATLTAQGTSL